jgi:hypothetical protein
MNDQRATMKSASPLGKGERTKVRGFTTHSQQQNPHLTLSLEKKEATENAT